jgi:hypothetical protein
MTVGEPDMRYAIYRSVMLKQPSALLRLEGFVLLAVSVALFFHFGGNVWRFLLLLLVPDLTMAGYALNVRVGAVIYNAGHTLAWPLALGGVALLANYPAVVPFMLIWTAHIGMDRMLGYGLKYPTYFADTHLQRLT